MICIAVPVCRPLYNRFLDKFTSRDTGSYQKQNGSGQVGGFALHTFGGSTLLPRGGPGRRPSLGQHKMGVTSTYAMAIRNRQEENYSDEEILSAQESRSERMSQNAIRVTAEVSVTRSKVPEGT
jgi:hypothetical protein